MGEGEIPQAPRHVGGRVVIGVAGQHRVPGGEHRVRQRIGAPRRLPATALVPGVGHGHALEERLARDAVGTGRRARVRLERARVVAEVLAGLAGHELITGRERVLRPVLEHLAIQTESFAPVLAGALLARRVVVIERDREPGGAGEGFARGFHGVRALRRVPRAPRHEAIGVFQPRLAREIGVAPALVGLGQPPRAGQSVGVQRVADERELLRLGGLAVHAVTAEVEGQIPQDALLVRTPADGLEMARERRGASGARQGVDQVCLGLALDVHVDPEVAPRLVDVEHRAERVGRVVEALGIEVGPAQLVERDRAQARIVAGRGALIERHAGGELALVELEIAHAQVGLLDIARLGMVAHELGEERLGFRVALVGQQHGGVEEHGVAPRESGVLLQDRAVQRQRGSRVHDRRRSGRNPFLLLGQELGHARAEALARVHHQDVRQSEAHLAARGGGGVPVEKPPQGGDRPRPPRRGLRIVGLLGRGPRSGAVRSGGRVARHGVDGGGRELHARSVGGDGQPVVDALALVLERRARALHGRAGHASRLRPRLAHQRVAARHATRGARLEREQLGAPARGVHGRGDHWAQLRGPRQESMGLQAIRAGALDDVRPPRVLVGAVEQVRRAVPHPLHQASQIVEEPTLGARETVGTGVPDRGHRGARQVRSFDVEVAHRAHPRLLEIDEPQDRGAARRHAPLGLVAHGLELAIEPAQHALEGIEMRGLGADRVPLGAGAVQPLTQIAPEIDEARALGVRVAVGARDVLFRLAGAGPGRGHRAPLLDRRRQHGPTGARGRGGREPRRRGDFRSRIQRRRSAGQLLRQPARRKSVEQQRLRGGRARVPLRPQRVGAIAVGGFGERVALTGPVAIDRGVALGGFLPARLVQRAARPGHHRLAATLVGRIGDKRVEQALTPDGVSALDRRQARHVESARRVPAAGRHARQEGTRILAVRGGVSGALDPAESGQIATQRAARVGDAQPGQRGLVVLPGARQGARVEIGLERRLFGPGAGARQETARAFHVAGAESEARRQRVRDAEADRPRRLRRIHGRRIRKRRGALRLSETQLEHHPAGVRRLARPAGDRARQRREARGAPHVEVRLAEQERRPVRRGEIARGRGEVDALEIAHHALGMSQALLHRRAAQAQLLPARGAAAHDERRARRRRIRGAGRRAREKREPARPAGPGPSGGTLPHGASPHPSTEGAGASWSQVLAWMLAPP